MLLISTKRMIRTPCTSALEGDIDFMLVQHPACFMLTHHGNDSIYRALEPPQHELLPCHSWERIDPAKLFMGDGHLDEMKACLVFCVTRVYALMGACHACSASPERSYADDTYS